MGLFTKCDGDQAVLINNGVYKQVDVYERDGLLYAALAGGYVRLKYDGSTSRPQVRLEHLEIEGSLNRTQLGALCRDGVPGSRPLLEKEREILQIAAV